MIRFRSRHIIIALLAISTFSVFWILQSSQKIISSGNLQSCCTLAIEEIKNKSSPLKEISCIVNNEKTYKCYEEEFTNEVYFPFNAFLKKHFDVSGKIFKESNSLTRHFEWSTSHARVRFPDFIHYDYRGVFGHFASYSVETRDRVRCISAQYGVPLSTQWSTVPYFYPIQIAQYALQHYSRFKNDPSSIAFVKGAIAEEWHDYSLGGNGFKLDFDEKANFTKVEINAVDHGVSLSLDEDPEFSVLSFFWMADVDGSFTISLKLIYTDYNYSLGAKPNPNEWRWICRDLLVDAGDIILHSIIFRGHSIIRDLKQRSSAHLEHFLVAADWLTNNQNEHGGWSVPVERSIADKRLILPAGWHSAMAQGHALSVLTRAYVVTNDMKYLQVAKRALRLFKTEAAKGGVLNELFGHPWFEEYPTTPGTFVLNGFLYSLIGLYDFAQVSNLQAVENDSATLFSVGLESLRIFLPLFDTGSGTFYDLRHLGLKTAPNLARWDYHSVHIYLLKWLYIITKDEFFNETANRWASYATGHRAKHN
ncbi:D-glucuronyl C5-epimerase [Onchocerca flexuosa]|uniref:D-glucuronyl C5-epimerase n=1 Tax=Onchocerca flexuosa TaxID=387005 RepID=A0A238BXP4_9BILA|nr:D-glucuronyl C5-epimerase [Onchocerca flexuosa]